MSEKNLALSNESIALALSENDGYEYYHIDDELRELAKDASDVQTENAKLRELVRDYHMFEHGDCHSCRYHDECRKDESCRCIAPMRLADRLRELGIEADS
jgi:hypothetical protein